MAKGDKKACLPAITTSYSPLLAAGLMSGTSLDGVDVAFITSDGESIENFGPSLTLPYPAAFRQKLAAQLGKRYPDPEILALEAELTDYHSEALGKLMAQTGITPQLIGFHGQTIHHAPDAGFTWQIGDGLRLAKAMGIPVINDFRTNDVKAGGQGAPLVPIYHQALLHNHAKTMAKPIVVLNMGGITNITWVGDDDNPPLLAAMDCGPGNALINDFMMQRETLSYDEDGRWAAQGIANLALVERWLSHPWFKLPPPRSLDRNQITLALLQGLDELSTHDGAATLGEFTAAAIKQALQSFPTQAKQVWVGGGGRWNQDVMTRLQAKLAPICATKIDDSPLALDGDGLEAQAFAFLAIRSYYGLPLSFPLTTGVAQPMNGGRYHQP